MRQISAQVLDPQSIEELESGQRLLVVRGGVPLAEIVPIPPAEDLAAKEQRRLESVQRLKEIMDEGIDLGGLRITNRDELYDRD